VVGRELGGNDSPFSWLVKGVPLRRGIFCGKHVKKTDGQEDQDRPEILAWVITYQRKADADEYTCVLLAVDVYQLPRFALCFMQDKSVERLQYWEAVTSTLISALVCCCLS